MFSKHELFCVPEHLRFEIYKTETKEDNEQEPLPTITTAISQKQQCLDTFGQTLL